MSPVPSTASLPLDFIVVGGGIAGLAVAYVLSKAGHRVKVFEKNGLNVQGGGTRVTPNFSKLLSRWIGEEELKKVAVRCIGSPSFNLRTGETVGYLEWKPAVLAETGGDFVLMHHNDIIQILLKLATEAGATVEFETEVASVRQGTEESNKPSVSLKNGETRTADIVIGADGCKSLVREVVLEEEDCAEPGGMTLYSAVIDAEDMLKDPDLQPFLVSDEWAVGMGPGRSMCGHPVVRPSTYSGKKQYAFHIYSWNNLDGLPQGGEESWDELYPTENLNIKAYGPAVQKAIKLTKDLVRTQWKTRDPIDDWVDSTGRIVLLGDAAHPSFPGGTHGSSMAVEDAVVFGSLFSHLSMMDQISSFLSAYQELRQRRCELVTAADIANARMVSLPDGPLAKQRDADMNAKNNDDWGDEGTLKAQFEEIAEIFVYDAADAAEEWWVNWGRFSSTAGEQPNVMNFFSGITMHHA